MVNKILLDTFFKNQTKEALIKGYEEIIKYFEVDVPYNMDNFIDNLINVVNSNNIITKDDFDIHKIINVLKEDYNKSNIIESSVEILLISYISNEIKVKYKVKDDAYDTNVVINYTQFDVLKNS